MQAKIRNQDRRRRARRGFSLLEIIVAIAIIAMVSAGATVAVVSHMKKSQIKMTETNARTIRNGVNAWHLEHDSSACPDVQALIDGGQLDEGKKVSKDAWDEPWRIVCEEGRVVVLSKGPDKKAGTDDDIRVPSKT